MTRDDGAVTAVEITGHIEMVDYSDETAWVEFGPGVGSFWVQQRAVDGDEVDALATLRGTLHCGQLRFSDADPGRPCADINLTPMQVKLMRGRGRLREVCSTCFGKGEFYQEGQVGVPGVAGWTPCPDCTPDQESDDVVVGKAFPVDTQPVPGPYQNLVRRALASIDAPARLPVAEIANLYRELTEALGQELEDAALAARPGNTSPDGRWHYALTVQWPSGGQVRARVVCCGLDAPILATGEALRRAEAVARVVTDSQDAVVTGISLLASPAVTR